MGTGPLCRQMESFQACSVANFVVEGRWDLQRLNRVLSAGWVEQVMGMAPPTMAQADDMIWAPTNSGVFTISSAYQIVHKGGTVSRLFASLWHRALP